MNMNEEKLVTASQDASGRADTESGSSRGAGTESDWICAFQTSCCTCVCRRDIQLRHGKESSGTSLYKLPFVTAGNIDEVSLSQTFKRCSMNTWRYFTWSSPGTRRKFKSSFLLLLILSSFIQVEGACKVDHCSQGYTLSLDSSGAEHGRNAEYCNILSSYDSCLTDTARSCRGNLKYHTTVALVGRWLDDNDCDNFASSASLLPPGLGPHQRTFPLSTAASVEDSFPDWIDPPAGASCHAKLFRATPEQMKYCVLFGDPHLKSFSDATQTCQLSGAWPLVDNDHLAVQVTSEPVSDDALATIIKEITISIRGPRDCSLHKSYLATSTSSLPSTFQDGSRSSPGDGSGLRLTVRSPGRHVIVRIDFLSTQVVVRRIRDLLSVAVHMPASLVETTASRGDHRLEVCSGGCPLAQQLDTRAFLARPALHMPTLTPRRTQPALPRDVALTTCQQSGVRGFFLEACVWDLLATGDARYRRMAATAQRDLLKLQAGAAAVVGNQTQLVLDYHRGDELFPARAQTSASSHTTSSSHIIITMLVSILITRHHHTSSS